MADDAEKSVDNYQQFLDLALKSQQSNFKFDDDGSGLCDMCGSHFSRLVKREYKGEYVFVCGGCRDKYKIG